MDLDHSPTAQDIGILLKMNDIWVQNVGPDHLSNIGIKYSQLWIKEFL